MKERVVLHLSDLHFGPKFVAKKWAQIGSLCRDFVPQMVVITGDVVDSPRSKMLGQAHAALKQLKAELRDLNGGREVPFVLVPGNHDARYFGIVPLYWTYLFSLCLFALLFLVADRHAATAGAAAYWLLALALLPVALQLTFCTTNLHSVFKGMLIDEPTSFADLRIGVIPLNSTPALSWGAHGKVLDDMVTPIREAVEAEANAGFFWIAAVHHHPLPIPCDDFAERSMIMKNAGTLLRNLISRHVPLVLHGHKHNAHFSRLLLDSQQGEREICVLAAGTATRKDKRAPGFSFNVIEIDGDNRARAIVFESQADVEFKAIRHHHISSRDFFARRQYEEGRNRHGVSAHKLVSNITIDEFGGAVWAMQFIGLASAERRDTCPFHFPVASTSGHVVGVRKLGAAGRGIDIRAQREGARQVGTTMRYLPALMRDDEPFDCGLEYLIKNFCSLDSVQFEGMYKGNVNMRAGMEHILFDMPASIALRQFVVHLRFPVDCEMPQAFHLEQFRPGETHWRMVQDMSLTRIETACALFVFIQAPAPAVRYRISWKIPARRLHASDQALRWEQALLRLSAAQHTGAQAALRTTLGDMSTLAYRLFIRQPQLPEQFEPKAAIAVYVYDRGTSVLRRVFNTGNDSMRGTRFAYGLGLVGLAFKAARILFMDKGSRQHYDSIEDGDSPLSDEVHDLIHEPGNGVAVPLYAPDDMHMDDRNRVQYRHRPYGVLSITFQGHIDTAFDDANSFAQANFGAAVSKLFAAFLKNSFLNHE